MAVRAAEPDHFGCRRSLGTIIADRWAAAAVWTNEATSMALSRDQFAYDDLLAHPWPTRRDFS